MSGCSQVLARLPGSETAAEKGAGGSQPPAWESYSPRPPARERLAGTRVARTAQASLKRDTAGQQALRVTVEHDDAAQAARRGEQETQ